MRGATTHGTRVVLVWVYMIRFSFSLMKNKILVSQLHVKGKGLIKQVLVNHS